MLAESLLDLSDALGVGMAPGGASMAVATPPTAGPAHALNPVQRALASLFAPDPAGAAVPASIATSPVAATLPLVTPTSAGMGAGGAGPPVAAHAALASSAIGATDGTGAGDAMAQQHVRRASSRTWSLRHPSDVGMALQASTLTGPDDGAPVRRAKQNVFWCDVVW